MTQRNVLWIGLVGTAIALGSRGQSTRGQTCDFAYRKPQVGDSAAQDVDFEMNLIVTLLQNRQTIHTTDRGVQRRQHRRVTVLRIGDGRVTEAKVIFSVSEQLASEGTKSPTYEQHPVVGKVYWVARECDGALRITDAEGGRPGPEEVAIVAQAMDAIGRRNPLALFFDRRSISVGQTVSLPKDLANDAIGCREAIGEASRFDMTLVAVQTVDGTTCATFDTRIDADSPREGNRRLALRGQFVLEVATCRTAAIQLSCPVSITETRGPPGGHFTVNGQGSLQISMRSRRARSF